MDIMMQPLVEATKDIDILNLMMKIICESILENIYNKQIKFTVCGALNLLKDFEGIAEWIENNKEVPDTYREKLMKHEVLKYCEGVGKILLREPDEVISMFPSPSKAKRMAKASSTDEGMSNGRRKKAKKKTFSRNKFPSTFMDVHTRAKCLTRLIHTEINYLFFSYPFTEEAQLPAEMFVPNQTRWLTLRAKRPRKFGLCTNVNSTTVIA
jgi:hypothetical protein